MELTIMSPSSSEAGPPLPNLAVLGRACATSQSALGKRDTSRHRYCAAPLQMH